MPWMFCSIYVLIYGYRCFVFWLAQRSSPGESKATVTELKVCRCHVGVRRSPLDLLATVTCCAVEQCVLNLAYNCKWKDHRIILPRADYAAHVRVFHDQGDDIVLIDAGSP